MSRRVVFNPFPITGRSTNCRLVRNRGAGRSTQTPLHIMEEPYPVPAIVAPDAIRAHDGMECRAWPGAANPQPCSDASGFGQS
jgi:hypothetical protein